MSLIKRLQRKWKLFQSRNQNPTQRIASFWQKNGVDYDYYAAADNPDWVVAFWGDNSVFLKLFKQLNMSLVLEVAAGTGRHSQKIVDQTQHLWLLDTSEEALKEAKLRFAKKTNVSYIQSADGMGIKQHELGNEIVTAVFSYDAMVHFEYECVAQYVKDIYRVLLPGGKALVHHSNYGKNKGGKVTDNPGWRNYMTVNLFRKLSEEAGFEVVQSITLDWAEKESDALTLLSKPV